MIFIIMAIVTQWYTLSYYVHVQVIMDILSTTQQFHISADAIISRQPRGGTPVRDQLGIVETC